MEGNSPPNPTELKVAASTPIGTQRASSWSIAAEFGVGIVLPLVVPAVVLGLFRSIPDTWNGGFRVEEVAFAFVALAIAAMVRAVSIQADSAAAVVTLAVIFLILHTAIGLKMDFSSDPQSQGMTPVWWLTLVLGIPVLLLAVLQIFGTGRKRQGSG